MKTVAPPPTPGELRDAFARFTAAAAAAAEHAADLAHSRRALFNAYLIEGFTPEQALELCKTIP